MTAKIRFHLDENVNPAVADGLRRRGIDVTLPGDVGLIGADDEAHVAFGLAQQRTIFTHDEDFLSIAARGEHPGIVYCHQQSRSVGQILGGLLLIADCLAAEEMRNNVEFL
jgi:predicted nuclease of predicted toxin-antitoxin system